MKTKEKTVKGGKGIENTCHTEGMCFSGGQMNRQTDKLKWFLSEQHTKRVEDFKNCDKYK